MRRARSTAIAAALACFLIAAPGAQEQQPPQPRAVFRTARNIVSVDVIVRDRSGAIVQGLTAADFEVREDGRLQDVLSFTFEHITDKAIAAAQQTELLAGVEDKVQATAPAAAPKPDAPVPAMTSEALAGRRLIVLLFDVSSMEPEDVQRAVDSARKYVSDQMSVADLVAVATVSTTLDVLTDFTGDRASVDGALAKLSYTEGTATPPPDTSTAAADELAAAGEETAVETTELDAFNNDVRLRAIRTLAETLAPIEQKKAIVYFSAGMERSGQDNQVELRSAINAAVRSNVAIYPIDSRGLQAVVPGGDARQASGRGTAMFSGRGVAQQFARLAASQDTLTSLAADTGGRAFTDTNDFGEAFSRVQRDMSAYYILGYSSTNPAKDGRFRRIQVRVKREDLRVEARAGYYADRDFAHTNRGDRESQLEEQLFAAVSATDLPVLVTGGYFRVAADKYYVPISLAVPGSAVPVGAGKDKVSLDLLGMVRDERGFPVGRFRQTLELPSGGETTLGRKQVLYQSAVTLPPGRFSVKVVVRENTNGAIGSFEAAIAVPELRQAPLKVSSIVLSTQLQPAPARKTDNPLVRGGVQLLPNVTHVVGRDQKLFFYYEVYEPAADDAPLVRTSLAFYRGRVKVFETPVVERSALDDAGRRAAIFQLEVPGESFTPGLYTCQINIIDAVAGKFAFPRVAMLVR